jgi:hypothetical protein
MDSRSCLTKCAGVCLLCGVKAMAISYRVGNCLRRKNPLLAIA